MLTLIHGKDTLRSRLGLRELLAAANAKAEFLEDENAFEEIRIRLEHAPLFGGKSTMVVEGGITGLLGTQLSDYAHLAQLAAADTIHVVLYEASDVTPRVAFKALKGSAKVVVYEQLSGAQSVSWLSEVFGSRSAITPPIVKEVFSRCNANMWQSYQELGKVSAYCGDMPATTADLDALGVGTESVNIFAAIDGLFRGDAAVSFDRLQTLWHEGQSPLGVFALIERQLRVTTLVKEADSAHASPADIAKTAGIPPFAVSRAVTTSRRMSWPKIKGLYARVESLDEKVKRGAIDPYFAVELLASAVLA